MSAPNACVIGWPISHSRSPLIHSYWLAELGLTGSYVRHGVEPEQLDAFLRNLADHGFVGCNVTLPHKEAAFAAMDEVDDTAVVLRAVNTIWLENGRLCGSNTDVYGFLANLDASAPGWDANAKTAVVLGAGGAARAIVYGLKARGFDRIQVVNRTLSRAEKIAEEFGRNVTAKDWNATESFAADTGLLVNTTSLGMTGQPPLEVNLESLPDTCVVTDIVYAPLITNLLLDAREQGLKTVDGLGMLLHQAVPGFEKWFGARPAVSPGLRSHVLKDLEPAT